MILYLCACIDINSFLAYPFILLQFCIFLYFFSIWIWVAAAWVIGSAIVIVIKSLIEGNGRITKVLRIIFLTAVAKLRTNPKRGSTYDILEHIENKTKAKLRMLREFYHQLTVHYNL
jgi:hypothetical protein